MCAWFSSFLLKAFASRVNRRIAIRIVRFARSAVISNAVKVMRIATGEASAGRFWPCGPLGTEESYTNQLADRVQHPPTHRTGFVGLV